MMQKTLTKMTETLAYGYSSCKRLKYCNIGSLHEPVSRSRCYCLNPYAAGGLSGQYKMMQKTLTKMTETLAYGYSSCKRLKYCNIGSLHEPVSRSRCYCLNPYAAGGLSGQYKMMQKTLTKMTETLAYGYSSCKRLKYCNIGSLPEPVSRSRCYCLNPYAAGG